MGSPAPPADRLATQALAARIVQSVVDDEPMPHGLHAFPLSHHFNASQVFDKDAVEELIFQLAYEVALLRGERDAAIPVARAAVELTAHPVNSETREAIAARVLLYVAVARMHEEMRKP